MPRMSAVPSVSPPELAPRVLQLDDDPMGRLLASRALRERGFDAVGLDRAREALEAIEGGGFDCAVCDMPMPDVDGIEFCRRGRASPRGAALPVPMLTSRDDAEATVRACEAGATDHVITSVNGTLLVHRIRQAMHLRQPERGDGRQASRSGPTGGAAPAGFEWRPAELRLRGSADLFRLLDRADAPATIADRRVLALIAPPDRRTLRRAIATLFDGGPSVRREVEVDTLAGRTRRLRVDVRHVTTDGRGALEVAGPCSAGAIDAVVSLCGGEFGLLLEGLPDSAVGLAIARDAAASLHEPFRVDGREVFLRVSVGVHAAEPNGDEGARRLARVEPARRAAAGAGGHCALAFEPSMAEPGHDRLESERDLHYALGRGEMSMHRPPQFDATDGRIVGFEALISRGCSLQQRSPSGRAAPLDEARSLADRHSIPPRRTVLETVS